MENQQQRSQQQKEGYWDAPHDELFADADADEFPMVKEQQQTTTPATSTDNAGKYTGRVSLLKDMSPASFAHNLYNTTASTTQIQQQQQQQNARTIHNGLTTDTTTPAGEGTTQFIPKYRYQPRHHVVPPKNENNNNNMHKEMGQERNLQQQDLPRTSFSSMSSLTSSANGGDDKSVATPLMSNKSFLRDGQATADRRYHQQNNQQQQGNSDPSTKTNGTNPKTADNQQNNWPLPVTRTSSMGLMPRHSRTFNEDNSDDNQRNSPTEAVDNDHNQIKNWAPERYRNFKQKDGIKRDIEESDGAKKEAPFRRSISMNEIGGPEGHPSQYGFGNAARTQEELVHAVPVHARRSSVGTSYSYNASLYSNDSSNQALASQQQQEQHQDEEDEGQEIVKATRQSWWRQQSPCCMLTVVICIAIIIALCIYIVTAGHRLGIRGKGGGIDELNAPQEGIDDAAITPAPSSPGGPSSDALEPSVSLEFDGNFVAGENTEPLQSNVSSSSPQQPDQTTTSLAQQIGLASTPPPQQTIGTFAFGMQQEPQQPLGAFTFDTPVQQEPQQPFRLNSDSSLNIRQPAEINNPLLQFIIQNFPFSSLALLDKTSPQSTALERVAFLHNISLTDEEETANILAPGETADKIMRQYALLTLFESMGGSQGLWSDTNGWATDPDECNWSNINCVLTDAGVARSGPSAVALELSLANNNLQGRIPPEIGALSSSLVRLDLSSNPSLEGDLPPTLSFLTRLESLSLSNAASVVAPSLPPPIAWLPNLLYLDLSNCDLAGEIPREVTNLKKLQSLNVSSNLLTGDPTSILQGLENLQRLDLSLNNFRGDVASFFLPNYRNMVHLDLSFNQFSGKLPSHVDMLPMIEFIRLSQNPFNQSQLTTRIGLLNQLVNLELENNFLTGPLPSEMGQNQRLKVLDLNNNLLHGNVPSHVGLLRSLTHLGLGSNVLTGTIPTEIGLLVNLQYWDMSQNFLRGTWDFSLDQFQNLTSLDLSAVGTFTGPIPSGLFELTKLSTLGLDNSGVSGPLPTLIGKLSLLTKLNLENNRLEGTMPTEIGNLTLLERFDCSRNSINGTLPTEIALLEDLNFLDLRTNEFTGDLPEIQNLSPLTFHSAENRIRGSYPKRVCGSVNCGLVRCGKCCGCTISPKGSKGGSTLSDDIVGGSFGGNKGGPNRGGGTGVIIPGIKGSRPPVPTNSPKGLPTVRPIGRPQLSPTPTFPPTSAPSLEPPKECIVEQFFNCEPESCRSIRPPSQMRCSDTPNNLVFRYTGETCQQSNTNQQPPLFDCQDFGAGPLPTGQDNETTSFVFVSDVATGTIYFSDLVKVGDFFALDIPPRETVGLRMNITVYSSAARDVIQQTAIFVSSCNRELSLGDQFGAHQVVTIENEDQRELSLIRNITFFLYNDGSSNVTIDGFTLESENGVGDVVSLLNTTIMDSVVPPKSEVAVTTAVLFNFSEQGDFALFSLFNASIGEKICTISDLLGSLFLDYEAVAAQILSIDVVRSRRR